MLFSLFSLNSLYSLLLGIVFDTHVCVGALSCLLGIVFDTREGGMAFPFQCRVSFSIHMRMGAWFLFAGHYL